MVILADNRDNCTEMVKSSKSLVFSRSALHDFISFGSDVEPEKRFRSDWQPYRGKTGEKDPNAEGVTMSWKGKIFKK